MHDLPIHTQIHSRYQVFDASGHLPFSIVFGLCRRSPSDEDSRPLLIDVTGSALDVPYALANGLLTVHVREKDGDGNKIENDVDLTPLKAPPVKQPEYLTLPSPIGRTQHWRDSFTIYQCPIDVKGDLASILQTGTEYRIKLASTDLGIRWWTYEDRQKCLDENSKPTTPSESARLVSSKPSAGNATFKVVDSLPSRPKIGTTLRISSTDIDTGTLFLEVSAVNTGSTPITVQTKGHQHFLIPWGPFQPEEDEDDRPRIIDAAAPTSSLQVLNGTTGKVVRSSARRSGSGPLVDSKADRRPKAEQLITLEPGVAIVRNVDASSLIDGLEDGVYRVRMQSKGCWWSPGCVEDIVSEDGRVREYKTMIPPLMLESEDEVEVRIMDGEVER